MKALEIMAVNLVLMQMASASPNCDSRCKGAQGICQADGRCFCWWGWTGPNATYITSGADKNRIMANYCTTACHYTHEYLNTSCASIPTPQVCSVPLSQPSQTWPCDSKCDTGSHYGRGTCLSNGRCLCWWGWTGPNACYVDGGAYNNRIIADFCANACHYNHVYRNDNCTTASPTTSPTTQPISTANPTTTIVRKERFVHYYNTGAGIVYHLDVVKDVWLERPTRNYNSFPWLIVARHPGFPNKRSLIQFENLPRRCSAAQIRSAKMYLYYLYAHKPTSQSIKTAPFIPRYLEVRLVNKYWREAEATSLYRYRRYRWSSQWLSLDGRDAEASPQRGMVTIFPNRPRGFVELDITDAVKTWRSGTPNHGLLIRATNELARGRDIRFASNRYSDKSKHAFVQVLCA